MDQGRDNRVGNIMSLEELSPAEFDQLARDYLRRHTLSRRSVLFGGAAASAAALLGLPAFAQAPKKGGTFRVGRSEEPDTLDPHKTTLSISSMTMQLVHEPLARRDVNGGVVPALAERWEFSNGNKTVTFYLKPGATFHDGTPADAEAVAYTVARHMSPTTASPSAFFLGPVERAEVINPTTVAYHYKEPFVPIWVGLTLGYTAPLSRKAVEALGDRFGRQPIGAGPFRFVSWSPDRGIRFERYKDYKVGPVPNIDAVEFLHYPEDATRLAALETGEINAIYSGQSVPLDAVRRLKGRDDITLIQRPAQMMRALAFNQKLAPTNNPDVRKALCHAVDPQRVVAFALDNNAKAATSPLPSTIKGFSEKAASKGYPFAPDKARAMLAAAGHGNGLQLKMIVNDTPPIRRTAEIIQAQLRDVGVTVTVESMPIGQWSVISKKGEHHLAISTYSYPDADIVFPVFHSTGALNRTFQDSSALDPLIEKQRVTFDETERMRILETIQDKIIAEAYWKPIFEPLNFALVDQKVKGAEMNLEGDILSPSLYLA
jgi:peptide/nickel transport system substrate-binding protein